MVQTLTALELAQRIKLLAEEQGWSRRRAAQYFSKHHSWVTHHVNIANNLSTTLATRVATLTHRSYRELAKLSKDKQENAYRIARRRDDGRGMMEDGRHFSCAAKPLPLAFSL
jgi:hypothetical protein